MLIWDVQSDLLEMQLELGILLVREALPLLIRKLDEGHFGRDTFLCCL